MTRRTKLVFGSVAAAVVVLGGVWLGVLMRDGRASAPRTSPSRDAQVVAGSLEGLVMDLELVPMDGQTPKPFTLESLDGRRVALADLAGRPALLYFWATW